MEQRQVVPPTTDELQAYSLGKCEAERAAEIESFLADGPDCSATLDAVPDDALLRQLRGAGGLPRMDVSPQSRDRLQSSADELGAEAAALLEHPRYRLLRKLGQGGMGTVYLAEHRLMRRLVAIKVIRAGYLGNPQLVQRFRQEMEAVARLSHPHIVAAHDADEAAGTHFLVMEFVAGESLGQLVAQGPLPVDEACAYIRQAALGLQFAHEKGMVHRDVKPHNLMLQASPNASAPPVVKILDFGLARVIREAAGPESQLTSVGTVMGTADYMAPEQAKDSRNADIRADVYSLGCTLYHLLSGHVPFPGGTPIDKIIQHATVPPEPLSRCGIEVPAGLAAVIDKMMAKKLDDRYQTPAEVAAALEPFTHPRGPRSSATIAPSPLGRGLWLSRRRGWVLAGALAAALLVGSIALVLRSGNQTVAPLPVEAEPPKIELVKRIPLIPAVRDFYYCTAVSTGGKYALVTREFGGGVRFDVYRVDSAERLCSGNGWMAQFLGDGEQIIVATDRFWVYESHSGKLLRQAEQKHRGLGSFKVAPGGKHLVYWADKGYVLFDPTHMREQHYWEYQSPGPARYDGFHFTADGKRLLLCLGRNEGWTAWDLEQNRASRDYAGLAGVTTINYLFPDGKTADVLRNNARVQIDMQTGNVLQESRGSGAVGAVAGAYSSHGRCFVVRCDDGSFLLQRLPFDGKEWYRYQLPADDRSLSAHDYTGARLALSVDDRYAALLTTRSLYVLRLPELPGEEAN